MNSLNLCVLFFFLLSQIICAQDLIQQSQWVDELGTPIRDVYLVNRQGTVHTFSDKEGLVALSPFNSTD